MVSKPTIKTLWVIALLFAASPSESLYGQEPAGNPTQPAAMSAAELQALVAPIALYPDPSRPVPEFSSQS